MNQGTRNRFHPSEGWNLLCYPPPSFRGDASEGPRGKVMAQVQEFKSGIRHPKNTKGETFFRIFPLSALRITYYPHSYQVTTILLHPCWLHPFREVTQDSYPVKVTPPLLSQEICFLQR